jgi:hypothetical protein
MFRQFVVADTPNVSSSKRDLLTGKPPLIAAKQRKRYGDEMRSWKMHLRADKDLDYLVHEANSSV